MDTKLFQERLERLWATRPVRPSEPRTIAGVATGIGARYRVDPTLVKVAFVVAALFGGSGLLLYLAAWIAFPAASNVSYANGNTTGPTARPWGHRHHRPWHRPRFLLFVVFAIVVITSFGPNRAWGSGGIVGALLLLIGWWLLFMRTPTPPPGTSVDTRPAPAPAPVADGFQRWIPRGMTTPESTGYQPNTMSQRWQATGAGTPTPASTPTAVTTPTTATANAEETTGLATPATDTPGTDPGDVLSEQPPAWDPLGTARFAWDLPEPSDPQPPEPKAARQRRSPLTLIVIGLAIIVAAIGAAANNAGADWFTTGRVLSLSLFVVGAGLVGGALRRRSTGRHSSGLVPVALGLGAAVVIATAGSHGFTGLIPPGGVGERNWKPIAETDIKPEYSLGMGDMTLDLRHITLTADRTVRLRAGLGQITVHVPPTMNVRADCSTTVGDYSCPDGLDGGSDGNPGPVLTVEAHATMGNVEISR
ncbi:PspC domain-containing protein [Gordonia sp. ABSL1-1]|uniref:PspC domain-containing protein n=1 Tax=Gordonia sp. ABSL1-1 TaxID=3053923 RepID=UPI003365A564